MEILCILFYCFISVFGISLALFGILWYLAWSTNRKCQSRVALNGKTVIITGSSAGIGKEAAIDFAQRGARVILACRNRTKATTVADHIIATTGNDKVIVKLLDTSSLKSVREFAKDVLEHESRLDILCLNAGIGGFSDGRKSVDGYELTIATNHLGHFLLVNLLSGLLLKSQPSRIVVTTSYMHLLTRSGDVKNFLEAVNYSPLKGYMISKLFNLFLIKYLATHFKDRGVTANCFCPGFVGTEIYDKSSQNFYVTLFQMMVPLLSKTPKEGAQTLIHLAVAEEVKNVTGTYFFGCKRSRNSSLGNNEDLVKKVWAKSEKIVKLGEHERLVK